MVPGGLNDSESRLHNHPEKIGSRPPGAPADLLARPLRRPQIPQWSFHGQVWSRTVSLLASRKLNGESISLRSDPRMSPRVMPLTENSVPLARVLTHLSLKKNSFQEDTEVIFIKLAVTQGRNIPRIKG